MLLGGVGLSTSSGSSPFVWLGDRRRYKKNDSATGPTNRITHANTITIKPSGLNAIAMYDNGTCLRVSRAKNDGEETKNDGTHVVYIRAFGDTHLRAYLEVKVPRHRE